VVEGREQRCQHGKGCNGFGNCYSCPPLAPNLERYNSQGYRNVLIYCFYADMEPFSQAKRIYKYQNAERTISPHIRKYGRILEGLLNGKDISDGRCKRCHPCNASLEPRIPCINYQELRCSLESLGVHVANLARDVLNHELKWWWHSENRKEDPPYITFVHGLLTNSQEPTKATVEPYYTR
jgi:predicted metal-binding protein